MSRKSHFPIAAMVLAGLLPACSARIYGTVQLVDPNLQPMAKESRQGTVVNMINTTATLEQASRAVTTDQEGKFETGKDGLPPGTYRVEVSRIGFETETQTVEIGRYTRKKVEFNLKKIEEARRKTIKGSMSDADKIVNPGEVNIQPPLM